MSFKNIHIKNFTVFEDVEIQFSEGINVFIGENGTGKTHLLKLLYAFLNTKADTSNTYLNNFDDILFSVLGYASLKDSFGWIFECTIDDHKYYYDAKQHLSFQQAVDVIFNETEYNQNRNSLFIPAKDMLTHAKGLLEMAEKYSNDMPFDKTLLDIIRKAKQWKVNSIPNIAKKATPILENIMNGVVIIENDTFYIEKKNGEKVNFAVEAEGIKKIGLLWQLLMNENIEKGSILLWDEPEANLNPKLIPDLVEILLELSQNGVQIFLATHDYILAKYFDVRKKENDAILFHALYKTEQGVKASNSETFKDLIPNPIVESFDGLMNEIYQNLKG